MNKTVVLMGIMAISSAAFLAGTYVGSKKWPKSEEKLLQSYREYLITTEHMINNKIPVDQHSGHWECLTELSYIDSVALHKEQIRINKLYKEQE